MTDASMRTWVLAAAYVAAYVLLDALSYIQPVLKLGITPWSPQVGLTLAFLVWMGPQWAVATAVAAFCAEILVHGTPATLPMLALSSTFIALGYAAGSWFLRLKGLREPIRTPVAAAWLIGTAVVVTLAVATGYVGLFVVGGILPAEEFAPSVARYWVGDFNGILTLAPLLLMSPRWREALSLVRRSTAEVLAQTAAIVTCLWLIFGIQPSNELRFYYPLFVPVVWIATRWGVSGATLAALGIQIGLAVSVQISTDHAPLVDVQFLMMTLSSTALLLGAAITERTGALRRVAMQEAEQRALLAMAPDAVLSVDSEARVVSANPAAARLFAVKAERLGGRLLTDLVPRLHLAASEGRISLDAKRSDGTTFPADIAWAPLEQPALPGTILIVRDATERHAAEARIRERDRALARAMRFAVAGELASALAHELNQPITALVSYLRAVEILAERGAERDARLSDTLGKAAREAVRAADVLRRLRDFYRGGIAKYEAVQVADVCRTTLQAFQERIQRSGVELTCRFPDGLPEIIADRTQVEMILHNLVGNALDSLALQTTQPRRLEVSAMEDGTDVLVAVEDSGAGVAEEVAERLFEPFITTKADGMGLGLAISRSLVRGQGGELHAERARLGGARFVLRLPAEAVMEATW